MLTIHLDLINHKLLSKLRIYENIWIKDSVAIQLVFLVPTIPDMSGRYIPDTSGIRRTKTLSFCPWPYLTRLIGAGQKQITRCLWFFILAIVFILCPASQQINCSTREPLKASYSKIKYFSISHFQYFINMPICELLNTKRTRWLSYKV